MENKMYGKHQYKCAICGTIYNDLKDRVNCETKCIRRQEEEAKKAAELKKKAEREARHAEVTKLIDDACTALYEYIDDYGEYEYAGKLSDVLEVSKKMDDYLPKMLNYFVF